MSPAGKRPSAAADEVTKRKQSPRRRVTPDPDYVADLENNDGQIRKRMAERDRGKPVAKPRGLAK